MHPIQMDTVTFAFPFHVRQDGRPLHYYNPNPRQYQPKIPLVDQLDGEPDTGVLWLNRGG